MRLIGTTRDIWPPGKEEERTVSFVLDFFLVAVVRCLLQISSGKHEEEKREKESNRRDFFLDQATTTAIGCSELFSNRSSICSSRC